MKIIYKEPYKNLKETEIEGNSKKYLDAIQSIIGGDFDYLMLPHMIKVLRPVDGKNDKLEPNLIVGKNLVLGNVVFVGIDEDENFTPLSELQEAFIRKKYN